MKVWQRIQERTNPNCSLVVLMKEKHNTLVLRLLPRKEVLLMVDVSRVFGEPTRWSLICRAGGKVPGGGVDRAWRGS
jgi:hypothetical protein